MLKKLGKNLYYRDGLNPLKFGSEFEALAGFKKLASPLMHVFMETACCKGAIVAHRCDVCGNEVESVNVYEVNEDQYAEMSAERLRRRLDGKV